MDKGMRMRMSWRQRKSQEEEDLMQAIALSLQEQPEDNVSDTHDHQSGGLNEEDDVDICIRNSETSVITEETEAGSCRPQHDGEEEDVDMLFLSNCSIRNSETSVITEETEAGSCQPQHDGAEGRFDEEGASNSWIQDPDEDYIPTSSLYPDQEVNEYTSSRQYEGAHDDDDVNEAAEAIRSINRRSDQDFSVRINDVMVNLCLGKITKKKMGALVNVTSPEGTLEGGLSKAFLKTGGEMLKVLFETASDYTDTVRCTEVPGDLGFKTSYILHVTLQKGRDRLSQSIDRAMRDIADICRRHGIHSIALPPLGINRAYQYPVDDVAVHMIRAIHRHFGCLQEINIVVHESDVGDYHIFKDKLQEYDMEGDVSIFDSVDSQGDNQDNVHHLPRPLHKPAKRGQRMSGDTPTKSKAAKKSNPPWSRSSRQVPIVGDVQGQSEGRIGRKQKGELIDKTRSMRNDHSSGSGKTVRSRDRGDNVGDGGLYQKSYKRHSSVSAESRTKISQIIKANRVKVTEGRDEFILLGNKDAVDQAHAEIMTELERKVTTDDRKRSTVRKKPFDLVECMAIKYEPTVPKYWTNYKPDQTITAFFAELKMKLTGDNHKKVELDGDSSIHKTIVRMMNKTFDATNLGLGNDATGLKGYNKLWVVKVERIENITQYDLYAKKRQYLFRELFRREKKQFGPVESLPESSGPSLTAKHVDSCWELKKDLYHQVNEGYMFHGTQEGNVKPICNTGLDPRLCQGEAMLGRGIYGAESAMKADQYADNSKKRTWGHGEKKKMFLIRMLLGDCFLSTEKNPPKYKRPPCKGRGCYSDSCRNHSESFSSIVSDSNRLFREFVVYEKELCYPEYLITYERR